jgi:ABC-type bacteriocin/lantibiotic exporter with double-glycine peptidase domain
MRAVLFLTLAIAISSASAQNCKIARKSPVFNQCDAAWGAHRLGSSSTVCKVGCAMCSVASGLAGLGRSINGQQANCGTFNQFLHDNGGYLGNLLVWAAANRLGVTFEGFLEKIDLIKDAVCKNKLVVLNVKNGGHWVLATGVDGNTFFVNDSGFNRNTYTASEVSLASVYRV